MSINKKIILAGLIYLAMCGGICWYCLGGDIVRDLSGYIKTNPGESLQSQQTKRDYNLNQYLDRKDAQTQEVYSNNLSRLQRSLDILDKRNNMLYNLKSNIPLGETGND